MTSDDDRTEARIRAAFAAELRRAETDVELSPLRVGRRPEGRSTADGLKPRGRHGGFRAGLAAATALAVVVLAVGAGLLVAGPRNATVPESPLPSARTSEAPSPSAATPQATSGIPRYGDGIPMVWQGQPVLRWANALTMRSTAKDDTPFLVGVWLNVPTGVFSCPMDPGPDPSAPNSWISRGGCQFNYVSTDAGGLPTVQNGIATFRFYNGELATGPAIMRVHLHDPRAGQCGYQRAICDDMIVVDDILWTGDAATAPHPLSIDQVIAAASEVSPTSDLRLPDPIGVTCGVGLTDGLVLCPPLVTGVPYTSPIAGAAVLPSPTAVSRALPSVQAGVDGALQPSAVAWSEGGSFGSYDYRWLVVDNVVVLVRTSIGGQAASDREFLNQLVAALKAQEANPSPAS